MTRSIGEIRHEGLTVKVEDYSGSDWEDHVIHIWDTLPGGVLGFHGIDGSVIERPSITLSPSEALELIALLAKAIDES